MPERRVIIRRVKTSDLIAIWKAYNADTTGYPPGSVLFGPGCPRPAMPDVADRDAVWLRYTMLSLEYPGLEKMPTWRRNIVCWFEAKRPFTVGVGAESQSYFAAQYPSL